MRERLALLLLRVLGGIPVKIDSTASRWNEPNTFHGKSTAIIMPGNYYLLRRKP